MSAELTYRFGDLPAEHLQKVHDGLALLGLWRWMPGPEWCFDGCTFCPERCPITGALLTGPCGVHDWLYTAKVSPLPNTPAGRAIADAILYHLLLAAGAAEITAAGIHTAVRLGAEFHYQVAA